MFASFLTVRRMGSTPWKGQPLCSGFSTFIGGKEVELDLQVSADQLPATQGDHETDTASSESPPQRMMPIKETRKFISPANFYGTTKPKVKLPL